MRPIVKYTLCALVAVGVAAPAMTASSDYFLKLGGVKGEAAAKDERHKDQIEILSWSWGETRAGRLAAKDGAKGGNVEYEWKVEEGESAAPAPGDLAIKGTSGAAKYGAVGGMHRDDGVQAPAAPAEKRQHGWVTVSKPLDRGAVRVKVKFPWLDCKVGARYPELTLGGDAQRYEMQDAVITSCGSPSGSGESLPMEEISFNYAKVQVRGWDPATKQK